MKTANKKAAGVLDTPSTALKDIDTASVPAADQASEHQKQIANLRAQLALLGHELRTVTRAEDARLTFVVSRWNESRTFSSTHDLQAFANQIRGVK